MDDKYMRTFEFIFWRWGIVVTVGGRRVEDVKCLAVTVAIGRRRVINA